jgi:mannose-6-phosphate isomerase-like protein (cupin superfamily)
VLRKGDILYNPVSGETFTLLKTSADTQGQLLQLHVTVEPGGGQGSPFLHLHPRQQETFRIRAGKLSVRINGDRKLLEAGETLAIPAGGPHQWKNASGEEALRFICELRPAMQWEHIFETAWALAQAGKLNKDGSPPFLQMAVTLNKYPHHFLAAGIPAWLQKAVFKIVAPVALLLGYRAEVDYKTMPVR